jgi:cytochrome c-type biogenesis protein CcmF
MLKVWNLSLVVGTFALTTFGTFLTRGSILSSVHAFAKSAVGPMYLGFLVLVLAGGFGLIAVRSWRLRSEGRFDAILSRESAFLGNNLVLLAVTFVVLLGTIFPLFVEALTDRQSTVGGPYFEQTLVPLFLLLLFLMGIGPLVSWRRTSPGQLRRRVTIPALAGAGVVLGTALSGVRSPGAVLAYGLATFVLVGNLGELIRGVRGYAHATGHRGAAAIPAAMSRNRRLYGGLVVHVGMALVAIAITTSSTFARRTEVTLSRGEQTAFAGYVLRYEGERQIAQPQRVVLVADVSVSKGGEDLGRVTPSLNLYPAASEPIGTPSVRFGVFRDFYVSLIGFDGDGERATFRFFINPGVTWLWVGGAIVALGGLLAAWPAARRTRAPRMPLIEDRELVVVSEGER